MLQIVFLKLQYARKCNWLYLMLLFSSLWSFVSINHTFVNCIELIFLSNQKWQTSFFQKVGIRPVFNNHFDSRFIKLQWLNVTRTTTENLTASNLTCFKRYYSSNTSHRFTVLNWLHPSKLSKKLYWHNFYMNWNTNWNFCGRNRVAGHTTGPVGSAVIDSVIDFQLFLEPSFWTWTC